MTKFFFFFLSLVSLSAFGEETLNSPNSSRSMLWNIDNLHVIGGNRVYAIGNPKVISSGEEKGVLFHGIRDQLILFADPIKDAKEFTIEIVLKPFSADTSNNEPRIFYLQDSVNENRRISMELRVTSNGQWYFDGFIKSELSRKALIDEHLLHPVNQWAHIAITYKDRILTTYINGVQELSGEVDFLPMLGDNIRVSLGARIVRKNYFRGILRTVRITNRKLTPVQFITMQEAAK
jgi:hypothetical protein